MKSLIPLLALWALAPLPARADTEPVRSRECGLLGSIAARIGDCSKFPGSLKVVPGDDAQDVRWRRVAREKGAQRPYEVWQDGKTGLLWSDVLSGIYRQGDGQSACRSAEGQRADAGVTERLFGIPTIEEFRQASRDGAGQALPNLRRFWFWTSSPVPNMPDYARVFWYGADGMGDHVGMRGVKSWIRCVGR